MLDLNPGQPDPPFEEETYKVLHVVPGKGPYYTIQEAINAASPGTRIQIASALYIQSITINKPDLILEPREIDSEVQITCPQGPIITVSLKDEESCTIKGLKLIHTSSAGKKIESFSSATDESFFDLSETPKGNEHWIRSLKISRNMNCAVWADGGVTHLDGCKISLTAAKTPLPGVVCSNGSLKVEKCTIKGHGEIPTVGIYVSEANLYCRKSKIFKHRGGGLALYGTPDNSIMVTESQIMNNINCGIYCFGEESRPTIQRSVIGSNDGPGIKVGLYCCAQIKANEIKNNEKGIEVDNGDPFVFLNIIKSNSEEGCFMKGDKDYRCDGKIMSNDITENDKGIVCSGSTCHTKIVGNGKISNNKKAGVEIVNGAHCVIFRNDIFENGTQGILLVKGSSSHIERNSIHNNQKANIAFGGCENSDTTIIENSIFRGKSEGIFNCQGGTSWIKRNQIYENSDGILLIDSHPFITMNSIYDNRRSGIIVAGNSQPNVVDNEVLRNTAVGICVRDLSTGLLLRNYTFGNLVQMAIITKTKMNIKQIKQENYIKGEVQLPLPTICSLL
ncbi:unnamed protein product [Blepharisma stoltei]|uniref:F-box protein 11 n=1 Tax=Blepharisma stoltei TaxID=1481888 RepID=A0AAU9JCL5_9CILI|nr:unnamed protein product [Blepharisma stoltei]